MVLLPRIFPVGFSFLQKRHLSARKVLVAVFCATLLIGGAGQLVTNHLQALDPIEDLERQKDELAKMLELSAAATTPLEKQVNDLDSRIKKAQAGITAAKKQASDVAVSIKEREDRLAVQYKIFSQRVTTSYKRKAWESPLLLFLNTSDAALLTRDLTYRQSIEEQDNRIIRQFGAEIRDLEVQRKNLEVTQQRLASLQIELDKQAAFFRKEIQGAKAYQAQLSSQIAALSARQTEILNARSGGFITSIGDSELADDYNASIKGFRESAPGGSFAVFSLEEHTHRKGMSQYGARGRARAGQDYKQILKAYYGKEPVSKDTGGSIQVAGNGSIDFETTYLYGIAEMPASWDAEALKAQAVAARSYAYRYKKDGKEICITEACQVFNKGKSANAPESWKKAVNDTKGMILEDVVTYYASTHGGYASPIGWDTTDGSGGSNFVDKSYDKAGGSPWVYKAWYTKGYSSSSDKCGQSNPWLTGEDLADIINAARFRDDRVTPLTTSCWGGNPYTREELRAKSDGPSKVSSVKVIQGNGSTNQVVFQTDKGEITLSGSEFKTAFNIRASGYRAIPQSSFAFFNIEQK